MIIDYSDLTDVNERLENDLSRPLWLTDEVLDALGKWPDPHVHRVYKIPVTRRSLTRWRVKLGIAPCQEVAHEKRNSLVPHIQAQVDRWRKRFVILKGWKIEVQHDPMEDCRTRTIDVERKRAVILTCQGLPTDVCDEKGVPRDYAIHEVLHVAYAAAQALDPKAGEETFVQDIAWMLFHGVDGKGGVVQQEEESPPTPPGFLTSCGAMSNKDDRDLCQRPEGHEGLCYTRGAWTGKGHHFEGDGGYYVWVDDKCPEPDDLVGVPDSP
jgi:hypothetical protein